MRVTASSINILTITAYCMYHSALIDHLRLK